jgi:ABC-type branched-subunit amino acid transport system substrate-binding protein
MNDKLPTMKKHFIYILFFSLLFFPFYSNSVNAQTSGHKIAIFAPLYLDSAFNSEGSYRYGNAFPKQSLAGLEFYEGVQLALDSLKKTGAPLDVFIYDSRSAGQSVQQILNSTAFENTELIIAHHNSSETKLFADAALKKNIPFISANMPNDGGVNNNPLFVLINPTIKTHCEGIYRYAQKYYSTNPVVMFRKNGRQEDAIKNYFADYGKSTVGIPLSIKYVTLEDDFTEDDIIEHLDSNRTTLCLAGSADESFGKKLSQKLATANSTYPVTVVGMPNWDGINFKGEEYKGLEIAYGTPFYNSKADRVSAGIISHFKSKLYARPTDMVFRGYEVTMRFTKLLLQYKKDIASNLANKYGKIFTDFDIQPVLNKQSMMLDYFENKKLYFPRYQDGAMKGVY